ncbi:M28 family peptidase [Gynurincola endophyticus]|uniref:M28 family peptidase n=1 Tax=Gynurincola endophyticus TaxID=2479004 RepID=UPI000F8C3D1D|nr:M28 family peptidase [Gynurincola endophyticus]
MKSGKLSVYVLIIALVSVFAACSSTKKAGSTPKLQAVDETTLMSHLQYLSSDEFKGRLVGSPESEKAQEFLIQQLQSFGVKPLLAAYRQPFTMNRRNDTVNKINANNVIGLIPGKKYKDKYIVLSAHYDHIGERNGLIFNGTDDNASGTSALIQFAKYFQKNQPDHNIVIAFFDAEESGLRGARHFVANLPVAKEQIILNVNMDMISRDDNNDLYACGTFQHPFLKTYIDPVIAIAPISIKYGYDDPSNGGRNDWTSLSDQGAFKQVGIPFIYFGVEDHADYHKATDTFEKVKKEFYVGAVRSILSFVQLFDKTFKPTNS